jgi:hypothetical protein
MNDGKGPVKISAGRPTKRSPRGNYYVYHQHEKTVVGQYPLSEWRQAFDHYYVLAVHYGYVMPRRDAWFTHRMHQWMRENPDSGLAWASSTDPNRKRRS